MTKNDYQRTHRAPPRRPPPGAALTRYTRRKLLVEASTQHMDNYHELMNLMPETCPICSAAAVAKIRLAKAGIDVGQTGIPVAE
mgnify:CR=1 FL=1